MRSKIDGKKGFLPLVIVIPVVLVLVLAVFFLSSIGIGEAQNQCAAGERRDQSCRDEFTIVFDECQLMNGKYTWVEKTTSCEQQDMACHKGSCREMITPFGFMDGQDCSDSYDPFHKRYARTSPCKGDHNKACGIQCDGKYSVGCSSGTVFVEYRGICN